MLTNHAWLPTTKFKLTTTTLHALVVVDLGLCTDFEEMLQLIPYVRQRQHGSKGNIMMLLTEISDVRYLDQSGGQLLRSTIKSCIYIYIGVHIYAPI